MESKASDASSLLFLFYYDPPRLIQHRVPADEATLNYVQCYLRRYPWEAALMSFFSGNKPKFANPSVGVGATAKEPILPGTAGDGYSGIFDECQKYLETLSDTVGGSNKTGNSDG